MLADVPAIASGLAKLLKLAIEGLPVGAHAGIANEPLFGMSFGHILCKLYPIDPDHLRSTFSFLLGAQLDIQSMAAIELGCVERPSPEAAKRCAAGAGLDGDHREHSESIRR